MFKEAQLFQAFIPILGPSRACAVRLPGRPVRSVRPVLSGHDLGERGIGRQSRLAGPDRARLLGVSLPLRRHGFYEMTYFNIVKQATFLRARFGILLVLSTQYLAN